MIFSKKTQIKESSTVAINTLAQQKKLAGQRVYNLSAGEPVLPNLAKKYYKDAVDEALIHGHVLYPPVPGITQLRSAAVTWINYLYGTSYQNKNCIVTCGGKFGIYLLLQALLNDFDEAIIIAPYWVSYPPMVELFGGVPVIIDTQESANWKVSAKQIEEACTERSKILILNNASNPTGVLYSKSELKAILEIAKKKNLLVISDEVYSGLVYNGNEFYSSGVFSEYKENVIVIQSCSKNFAMTGLRVGFVFGPDEIIEMLIKLQGQSTTGTSIISQYAAVAAFENADAMLLEVKTEMKHRRDLFVKTFEELFGVKIPSPLSALYIFVPLTIFKIKEENAVLFCKKVLEECGVAMVPGDAFGKRGYVRFSFGEKEEELVQALRVLHQFIFMV